MEDKLNSKKKGVFYHVLHKSSNDLLTCALF